MTVKILSITLLLLSVCKIPFLTFNLSGTRRRHPGRIPPCCPAVTKGNRTAEVVGETYREQAASGRCVKAIIFNTEYGQLCADPDAQWVKDRKSC
uniref:Chemokine interleukin-8-like domain-containing protein n=1 Tax=Maylandia zebra TaxID=106582 RepID=A0A3P9DG31_9CICH